MKDTIISTIKSINADYTYSNKIQLERDIDSGDFAVSTVPMLKSINVCIDGTIVTYKRRSTIVVIDWADVLSDRNEDDYLAIAKLAKCNLITKVMNVAGKHQFYYGVPASFQSKYGLDVSVMDGIYTISKMKNGMVSDTVATFTKEQVAA